MEGDIERGTDREKEGGLPVSARGFSWCWPFVHRLFNCSIARSVGGRLRAELRQVVARRGRDGLLPRLQRHVAGGGAAGGTRLRHLRDPQGRAQPVDDDDGVGAIEQSSGGLAAEQPGSVRRASYTERTNERTNERSAYKAP